MSYPTDEHVKALADIGDRIRQQPGSEWWWASSSGGEEFGFPDFHTRAMQALWQTRAEMRPSFWVIPLVACRKCSDRPLGVVELIGKSFVLTRSIEIGIWVDPREHRSGIGQEISQIALAIAFHEFGAKELRWNAIDENVASIALAEKLGFERDGTSTFVESGKAYPQTRFVLRDPATVPQREDLSIQGLDLCIELLGVSTSGG